MGAGRLGHERARTKPLIGDLVVCVDESRRHDLNPDNPKRFIGLVLDKSITVYRILVVDTGEEVYWPEDTIYLWKEGTK